MDVYLALQGWREPGGRAPSTVARTEAMSSAPAGRAPGRAVALRWPPILQDSARLVLPQHLGVPPVQFRGENLKCKRISGYLTAHC